MNYRLDRIVINCSNLAESVPFYEIHFAGRPTPFRQSGKGGKFCFINMSGAAATQLIRIAGR